MSPRVFNRMTSLGWRQHRLSARRQAAPSPCSTAPAWQYSPCFAVSAALCSTACAGGRRSTMSKSHCWPKASAGTQTTGLETHSADTPEATMSASRPLPGTHQWARQLSAATLAAAYGFANTDTCDESNNTVWRCPNDIQLPVTRALETQGPSTSTWFESQPSSPISPSGARIAWAE